MTVSDVDLRRFYTNCDPNKPLSGEDTRYVSLDDVRGSDASTCVDELEQTIRFSSESCHAIYTFPLWLRYRRADLGASYDREPLVLPMVKVTDPNGKPAERGIERLLELLAKRVDLSAVFGPDWKNAVRPLILASGGYPRDLLRLVRNVLTSNRAFPVGPANVERVIDKLAEDYGRTVLGTDLDVLVTIAKNHELPRDNSENLDKFVRLLDRYLVLAYRNGKEWYDAHPMVRRDMRVKQRIEE